MKTSTIPPADRVGFSICEERPAAESSSDGFAASLRRSSGCLDELALGPLDREETGALLSKLLAHVLSARSSGAGPPSKTRVSSSLRSSPALFW
jgi:hypothetical protein